MPSRRATFFTPPSSSKPTRVAASAATSMASL